MLLHEDWIGGNTKMDGHFKPRYEHQPVLMEIIDLDSAMAGLMEKVNRRLTEDCYERPVRVPYCKLKVMEAINAEPNETIKKMKQLALEAYDEGIITIPLGNIKMRRK